MEVAKSIELIESFGAVSGDGGRGDREQLVGGFTHRGYDRYDALPSRMQVGETARDRADFFRRFKTGAAVFLHDDGIVAHSADRSNR